MQVRDVMTENPLVIDDSARISEALNALLQQEVRHLPVVRDRTLVGIVTDRDLREFMAPPLFDEHAYRALLTRAQSPVSGIMNTSVVTVNPDSDLGDAVDLMLEHRIGAVPVVDTRNGRVVGIVSQIDVLRELREQIDEL